MLNGSTQFLLLLYSSLRQWHPQLVVAV